MGLSQRKKKTITPLVLLYLLLAWYQHDTQRILTSSDVFSYIVLLLIRCEIGNTAFLLTKTFFPLWPILLEMIVPSYLSMTGKLRLVKSFFENDSKFIWRKVIHELRTQPLYLVFLM